MVAPKVKDVLIAMFMVAGGIACSRECSADKFFSIFDANKKVTQVEQLSVKKLMQGMQDMDGPAMAPWIYKQDTTSARPQ